MTLTLLSLENRSNYTRVKNPETFAWHSAYVTKNRKFTKKNPRNFFVKKMKIKNFAIVSPSIWSIKNEFVSQLRGRLELNPKLLGSSNISMYAAHRAQTSHAAPERHGKPHAAVKIPFYR